MSPKYHEELNGNMNKDKHKTSRLLLGVAKYKEYTNQHIDSMCHACIKSTRLLLGVAKKQGVQKLNNKWSMTRQDTRLLLGVTKYKEYNASQHINSMCHECIKTTRLLLGVAKYKEYTNQCKNMEIT